MKEANYRIDGQLPREVLGKLPADLQLRVYAVRDRRVLGSSTIREDGAFRIEYKYEISVNKKARHALGPQLIVGPDLEGDAILKQGFPRVFITPKMLKETDGDWCGTVPRKLLDKAVALDRLQMWPAKYCWQWRPCVQVLACSKIEEGLCYNEQPVPGVRVRIYEVRWPLLLLTGTQACRYTVLAAEGDADEFGYFRPEKKVCRKFWTKPLYIKLGYIVEVGQMIDGMFNLVYRDPEDQLRDLANDLCEEIYICAADLVGPEEPEVELTGRTFKLTRIGDIPVGYINQDPASPFHGYANTGTPSDSATLPVVDSAFHGKIMLFANIGEQVLDEVKHYRIRYSYEIGGTGFKKSLQVPFYNLRETTDAEKPVLGQYKTELMGPMDTDVYVYPNPYDIAADKQWVYKGLIMVLNTATLELPYGRFRFTVEPLDANKNPVPNLDNPDAERTCTILVDNTPPSGSIGDIIGPDGATAPACGFLELPQPSSGAPTRVHTCAGTTSTRERASGQISVPFRAQDEHGNIESIVLQAHYGDECDEPVTIVGPGKKPTIGPGGPVDCQSYGDVPVAPRPVWSGRSDFYASSNGSTPNGASQQGWDECAYEFRLTVFKRVTNGKTKYPWWTFAKHITIIST